MAEQIPFDREVEDKREKGPKPRVGAVPYRYNKESGEREFLLVTTKSGSGNWVFPKGKIDKGKTVEQTVREEVLE